MKYEFKIGWCPFCGQGWAEIVKNTSDGEMLVMCSECDTTWNSPEDFNNNKPNANYEIKGQIADPTIDEVELTDGIFLLIKRNSKLLSSVLIAYHKLTPPSSPTNFSPSL